MNKEIIQEYFQEKFPERLTIDEIKDLYLLTIGEKPGVLVLGADHKKTQIIQNYCKHTELEYKVEKGGKRALIDKILRRDTRLFKDKIYLTKNTENFEKLQKENEDHFSEESIGKFLGYPETATKFYKKHEIPGQELENKVQEMKKQGKITEEDAQNLSLVSYVPKTTEKQIKEAIRKGKDYRQKMKKFDKENNLEIGREIIEKQI